MEQALKLTLPLAPWNRPVPDVTVIWPLKAAKPLESGTVITPPYVPVKVSPLAAVIVKVPTIVGIVAVKSSVFCN